MFLENRLLEVCIAHKIGLNVNLLVVLDSESGSKLYDQRIKPLGIELEVPVAQYLPNR